MKKKGPRKRKAQAAQRWRAQWLWRAMNLFRGFYSTRTRICRRIFDRAWGTEVQA
jgi:hypothetical protein